MSLFRKAMLINSSSLICLAFSVLQAALLSRILGPGKIGQYSIYISVLMISAQLFSFGIPLSYLFHSKHYPSFRKVYLMNTIWLMFLTGILGGLILNVVFLTNQKYFGQTSWPILVLAFIYIPLVLQRVVTRNYLLIDIHARKISLMELSAAVVSLIGILILVISHRLTVTTAISCLVIAVFVRAILGWKWMVGSVDFSIRPKLGISVKLGKMGIRQSWVDLMIIINAQLNLLLLKYLLDDFETVGYYSRAQSLAMLAVVVSQAVFPVLFSRWASMPETNLGLHVEKVLRFAGTLGLFIMVFVLVGSKWLILLLYGKEFLPAVGPMMILIPGTVLYLMSNCITQLLGSRGIPEIAAILLFIGAMVNVALSWVLIPKIGINGAAIAATLSNMVLLATLLGITKAKYKVRLTRCIILNKNDMSGIFNALKIKMTKNYSA